MITRLLRERSQSRRASGRLGIHAKKTTALFRPAVIVQDGVLGIGAGLWKRGFRKVGLANREQDPQAVGIRQRFIPLAPQARVFLQEPPDGVALFFDGGLPAPAAQVGLVWPFQEMPEQDAQATFQLLLLAGTQVLQFLGQVSLIDLLPAASADQPRVVQGPGMEILLVSFRQVGQGVDPHCK
jgi:hypothetical protein